MYRGRPLPPRGGYPQQCEGRGPTPVRPYPGPPFREERGRPRPPFQGYHDGPPDPYRRSPPLRRYPSPGSSSHSSPRGGIPTDHSLVITVGNELTGPPGAGLPSRDYPPYLPKRSSYDGPDDRGPRRQSPSRGRSRHRSRSPGIRGRSKSRPRSHSPTMGGQSKSRARTRSPAMGGRKKSRARSRSPTLGGRSKSRVRSRSPGKSLTQSRSPELGGQNKSRARSRSPEMGGRSKSRPPSRSRSRSGSRAKSVGPHKSRSRSVSTSSSSSSSSSSSRSSKGGGNKIKKMSRFKELELARRHKEMEDMNMPTKSILKRRMDSEIDSPPFVQNSDSPFIPGAEAERLLSAMKGMDPNMLATMLGELRDDPRMAQGRLDPSGIAGMLGLLGGASAPQEEKRKRVPDIDDEEKFLYGDEDDLEKGRSQTPAGRSSRQQQVDMRYQHQSKSSATPDHNIKVEEPNDYPLGTEPLEGKEKQDVEEYEKIQDLLKTIGLDLGVTEISKMAARTQERLHGKRPPPKPPSPCPGRRRGHRDSSRSSGRSRGMHNSHSGSSSSSGSSRSESNSPSRSRSLSSSLDNRRNQKKSPPSDRRSTHGKTRGGGEVKTETTPVTPTHPSISIPAYAQAQGHGLVPPNYPPHGFGQYGNWPYMPQQWPMYPPPSMGMLPQSPIEDFPKAPPFDRPYLNVIRPELHQGGERQGENKPLNKWMFNYLRVLEERNNESQKKKVLEEREKLRRDRDIRMKKKDYLMKELERLRKQQGELLRKKRREKDGHKDPLLSEISRLQEEVMSQIAVLRNEHEVAEKKRCELDKVALILGLQPTDKASRRHSFLWSKKKYPNAASLSLRASTKKSPASTQPPEHPADLFEYYDAGNHWCKSCNVTCGSMFDFFTHLHSKSHRKTQDPYNRPWTSSSSNNEINKIYSSGQKMTKPAKGSEFLVPVRGYYCQLCEEFYGDAICAEDHATSHTHNEKYKKRMYEYPLYEQRRNLDRQAGLTLEVGDKKHSEFKRKHEEEDSKKSKEKEEGKHKRSKKDKGKDNEKFKHMEKEGKAKHSKKEKYKYYKREEEERAKYSKKEEEEGYKHSKEGEEWPKYSKKDEERYKHSEEEEWLKNRREEEERPRSSRVEERPKFSWRHNEEEEDRSRYGKGKEPNPKYSKKEEARCRSEREDGKPKNEKEERQSRKDQGERQREDEKSGSRKQSEPEKPGEPPKVFCGPNPALRAKLRKKSEETTKVEPKAPSAFGKFSWKKKLENELAKEAERVAAEFLKEDEADAEEDDDPDAFSKSVAAAKSIAIKLSGKTVIPPTNTWVPFNSGKIRPNLPAPSVVLRKSSGLGPWVYAKPAPLNTFPSIKPPGASGETPLPVIQNQPIKDPVLAADIISKAFCGEELESADGTWKPGPDFTPDKKKASTMESVSQAPTSTPSAVMSEFKTPLPPPPVLIMMTMESDVSAPGVPESEQNVPVMVTPPPFMQRPPSEVMKKSEKPKSSLAAAKAQDLFDIFYSSSTTSTTSTAMSTKAVIESKAAPNYLKNRETLEATAPQTEQIQPELSALDNSNTIETDTKESMETERGSDPQPKEDAPENSPKQLDNPSDTLGISTETLDLPTEVLGLDLFDLNFD
uniref:C2H2-type domain-containing protein n=1 Tax=Oncorhynchus tshawytscha TaxID=74940 RepID=A0AAZ3RZ51_ONCTS